ncbi:N-alpha-acetyltransferase 50 [Balamuthia mandrillaris]
MNSKSKDEQTKAEEELVVTRGKGAREEGAVLGHLTEKNIGQLKLLNSILFPVHYDDKFYRDLLLSPEFTRLAFFNDVLVGAVSCRVESKKEEEGGGVQMYIMTLGVLAPYRRLGIGNQLLEFVIEQCKKREVGSVYLHVQISNEDALAFYKRYDFEVIRTIENYYKRIDPPRDCYVLQRTIDLSSSSAPATSNDSDAQNC